MFNFISKTIVSVFLLAVVFSCSNVEQLVDEAEIIQPTLNAVSRAIVVEPDVTTMSALTREESIALAVERKGTYKIDESEAIGNLERFKASFDNEDALNTKSIVLKKNPKTGKDLYYEVVFESEKGTGFSILSADERADHLLCYTEVGAISDTAFNKNMKFCLDLVYQYVEEQTKEELNIEDLAISAKEKIATSIKPDVPNVVTRALPPFDPNIWTFVGYVYKPVVSERLKLVPGGWYQDTPFNDYLPVVPGILTYNGRAAAGCVTIAVGQIMSYHKKPFKSYITTSTWTSINTPSNWATSVPLKNLILDIFNAITISYGPGGTSSDLPNVQNFLNANGFTAGAAIYSPSFSDFWNALNYGPAYIQGTHLTVTDTIGHAWVIDGARNVRYEEYAVYNYLYGGKVYEYVDYSIMYSMYQEQTVRFDWGWLQGAANNNGWYSSGVFRPRTTNNHLNFNTDIRIISSIK